VLVVGGIMEDKEIDEAIDEAQPMPNGLPEAPASATVRVWIDGYGVLLTMRSEKVGDVVDKLEFIISKAKEKGWKSTWKEEGKKETKETKTKECQCGGTKKLVTGIKGGKKWAGWFCDNEECSYSPEWINLRKK